MRKRLGAAIAVLVQAYPIALVLSGAFAVAVIAAASTVAHGPALVAGIERKALAARDAAGGRGIEPRFVTASGALTRHAQLAGGERLDDALRARVAGAIARVPGVAGVSWLSAATGQGAPAERDKADSLHCQQDVEAILKVRTIRFSEASAAIDPASDALLDEVASALRPCLGSIIAVTGHTDAAGDEGANLALSRARAETVRWALVARGIPADGLRASGKGSQAPLEGLTPTDPANRRIEFSVIRKMPIRPTPVDTPGPG